MHGGIRSDNVHEHAHSGPQPSDLNQGTVTLQNLKRLELHQCLSKTNAFLRSFDTPSLKRLNLINNDSFCDVNALSETLPLMHQRLFTDPKQGTAQFFSCGISQFDNVHIELNREARDHSYGSSSLYIPISGNPMAPVFAQALTSFALGDVRAWRVWSTSNADTEAMRPVWNHMATVPTLVKITMKGPAVKGLLEIFEAANALHSVLPFPALQSLTNTIYDTDVVALQITALRRLALILKQLKTRGRAAKDVLLERCILPATEYSLFARFEVDIKLSTCEMVRPEVKRTVLFRPQRLSHFTKA